MPSNFQLSKTDLTVAQAAANAVSILVRAGICFNGSDLQGIRIPGADLSEGHFDSTRLQDADLTRVNLTRTWLRQADLSRSQLTDAWFGEKPYREIPGPRSAVVLLSEKFLVMYGPGENLVFHNTLDMQQQYTIECFDDVCKKEVAISSDGLHVALRSTKDPTIIQFWNLQAGKLDHELKGHSDYVYLMVFSPGDNLIASSSRDDTVRIWDVKSGSCSFILEGHGEPLLSVVWSPDGHQIASGDFGGVIRLWSAESGELERVLNGEGEYVANIVYSHDGGRLAAGGSRDIRLWDLTNGNKCITLEGHGSLTSSAVFSRDDKLIAAPYSDGSVRLSDGWSGSCITSLNGHSGAVTGVLFLSDQEIVSIGGDRTLRSWQLDEKMRSKIKSFDGVGLNKWRHGRGVFSMKYAPNGETILSGGQDGTVLQWNAKTGDSRVFLETGSGIHAVVVSPDSRRTAVVGGKQNLFQFGETASPVVDSHAPVTQAAYSRCGHRIALGYLDGTVTLWDTRSDADVQTLVGDSSCVMQLVFSADGRQLASMGNSIHVWNTESAQRVEVIDGPATSISYSPCGRFLAVCKGDYVQLLEFQTKEHAAYLTCGLEHMIRCIEWSPCGQWLAAGADDQTVRLWKIGPDGSEVKKKAVCDFLGSVRCLSWNPSVPLEFTAGCWDNSVSTWRIVEDGGNTSVELVWGSLTNRLITTGTKLMGVTGLTELGKTLLIQGGATDGSFPAAEYPPNRTPHSRGHTERHHRIYETPYPDTYYVESVDDEDEWKESGAIPVVKRSRNPSENHRALDLGQHLQRF